MKKQIIRKVKGGLYLPEFKTYPATVPAVEIEPVADAVKRRGGYRLSMLVVGHLTQKGVMV